MKALNWIICAALLAVLNAPPALAETVYIKARYRPDQADFLDVNPPRGLCVYYVFLCTKTWKSFGVALPVEFSKHTIGFAPDLRDQFYLRIPSSTPIEILHERTGERLQVNLEWVAFQQRVHAPDDRNPGYGGVNGGCSNMRGTSGADWAEVGWFFSGTTSCFTSGGLGWAMEEDSLSDNVESVIRIQTPSPHRMKHGFWRGRTEVTVGNGGDLDLGNRVSMLRGDRILIDIELEVQHAFVLDFPPDSDKAVLEPPGGWGAYEHGGQVPTRLYRVHPFRLWSSGPFKAYIECQRNMGSLCGLMDRRSGHQVPFSVALTLPPAHTQAGVSVEDRVLPVGRGNALQFDSSGRSLDRGGALRYEVSDRAVIAEMLRHAGATYSGTVWIVFDAEL